MIADLLHCYRTPYNLYQLGSHIVKYNCAETFLNFPLFNYNPPPPKKEIIMHIFQTP